jgi:cytochrome subunit of sulfide dehydrogenase
VTRIARTVIGATGLGVYLACALVPAANSTGLNSKSVANIARNCFACHDPGGQDSNGIPTLQDASAKSIADALKQFQTGARVSTMMGRHARAYSDAQIDAIADYIAGRE